MFLMAGVSYHLLMQSGISVVGWFLAHLLFRLLLCAEYCARHGDTKNSTEFCLILLFFPHEELIGERAK